METYESPPVARSYSLRREALAMRLMRLMTDAGLNRSDPDAARPRLGRQFKALHAAARKVELDQDLTVASFLSTYLPALPEFMDKITAAPAARFPKTRLHGGWLLWPPWATAT